MPYNPQVLSSLVLLTSTLNRGEPVERIKAIDNYIKTFVQDECKKMGNSAEWDYSGSGGYIIRKIADINGDNMSEMLLTISADIYKQFGPWQIFDLEHNTTYSPYNRLVYFHAGSIYINCEQYPSHFLRQSYYEVNMPDGAINLDKTTDQQIHPLFFYELKFPDIIESIKEMTKIESGKIKSTGKRISPEVEVVSLYDYLTNDAAQWITIGEWTDNVHDHLMLPEDEKFMMANVDFTPKVAMGKLLEFEKQRLTERQNSDTHTNSTTTLRDKSPKNHPHETISSEKNPDKDINYFLIISWIVALVVTLSIFVKFLYRICEPSQSK